jgi:hypothetical protein
MTYMVIVDNSSDGRAYGKPEALVNMRRFSPKPLAPDGTAKLPSNLTWLHGQRHALHEMFRGIECFAPSTPQVALQAHGCVAARATAVCHWMCESGCRS